MPRELKLGIFVFAGTVLLAIGILTLGEVRLEKGYYLHILFDDIAGLLKKAPVRIAGVEVGTVKDITLEKGKAKVTVWVRKKIVIRQDTTASIITSGVIGIKYLEMTLGSENKPVLKDGDVVIGVNPISFDKAVNQAMQSFDQLVATLQTLTGGGKVPENINLVLQDIHRVANRIESFMKAEDKDMKNVVSNTAEFSKALIHLADKMRILSENLDDLTTESKKEIKHTFASLRSSSENLQETLGTLNRLGKHFEVQITTTVTPVGKLFTDKQFALELEKSIRSFNELLEGIKKKFRL